MLRDAGAHMSAKDISAALSAAHSRPTDLTSTNAMVARIRAALARKRAAVVEQIDGADGLVAWVAANPRAALIVNYLTLMNVTL